MCWHRCLFWCLLFGLLPDLRCLFNHIDLHPAIGKVDIIALGWRISPCGWRGAFQGRSLFLRSLRLELRLWPISPSRVASSAYYSYVSSVASYFLCLPAASHPLPRCFLSPVLFKSRYRYTPEEGLDYEMSPQLSKRSHPGRVVIKTYSLDIHICAITYRR